MKNWITAIIAIILFAFMFWLGFKAHARFRPCLVDRDTIRIYDTIEHKIPDTIPFYYARIDSIKYRDPKWMDSVIKANKVDTNQILLDYYMLHYYTGEWKDTLVDITIQDAVTENKIIDRTLTYKLLKPVTVINNSVTNINYQSYLYACLSVPLNDYKFASGNVYLANKRLLIGVGYVPYYKSFNVTAGFKLARFKR